MEINPEQWIREWERYVETRHCPVCGSDQIADVHLKGGNGKKIENCLDCDWNARSPGLGHCDHEADEEILNVNAQART
jgi:formate dehydrogenase maturation protein FdhE